MTSGDVYKYFKNAAGIATKSYYPDSPSKGVQCLFNYTMDGIQILGAFGYERIAEKDEEQLKRAVR